MADKPHPPGSGLGCGLGRLPEGDPQFFPEVTILEQSYGSIVAIKLQEKGEVSSEQEY